MCGAQVQSGIASGGSKGALKGRHWIRYVYILLSFFLHEVAALLDRSFTYDRLRIHEYEPSPKLFPPLEQSRQQQAH